MFRYFGTTEGWNFVVTRLIADIAENYYELMALDKRIENLDRIIALQEPSLERAKALQGSPKAPSWVFSVSWPKFARTRAKS